MKHKVLNFIRVVCLIAVFVGAVIAAMDISARHQADCPQFYSPDAPESFLPIIGAVIAFILSPLVMTLIGKLCGFRPIETGVLFLRITWGEKVRVRLTKPAFGTMMLPPRADGTSPFVLPMLSAVLYMGALSLLCALLLIPCWETAAARMLMVPACYFLFATLVLLLPRKNGSDALSRVLSLRRSRDLRRAWECAMHVAAALYEKQKLLDMPDEWFQTYPAELAEDYYVSNCLINSSSRLIRQYRFAEAYEMLRPLLNLKPAPDTHQPIACAILNGAICEAMADLPPMCLSQLEHQSVQYMTPPTWQPRTLTAKYARALFITHDEAEAAALLPSLEKAVAEDQADGTLLQMMREKAGLIE